MAITRSTKFTYRARILDIKSIDSKTVHLLVLALRDYGLKAKEVVIDIVLVARGDDHNLWQG